MRLATDVVVSEKLPLCEPRSRVFEMQPHVCWPHLISATPCRAAPIAATFQLPQSAAPAKTTQSAGLPAESMHLVMKV